MTSKQAAPPIQSLYFESIFTFFLGSAHLLNVDIWDLPNFPEPAAPNHPRRSFKPGQSRILFNSTLPMLPLRFDRIMSNTLRLPQSRTQHKMRYFLATLEG